LKMTSLTLKECSICENKLNETDDLVITDCNHIFHRNCAQERLNMKKKSDCHFCHQESALGNALSRLQINKEGECSICESLWNSADDLVTTDCHHTFHYICAQDRLNKRGRTDCHVCHKDSALGNALCLKDLTRKKECSICENSCNKNDDIVTTSCNHTFHRSCAQDRLNKRGRTDCHFCHRESALGNILSRNTTTTTIKNSREQNVNSIKSDNTVSNNETSRKRCSFCGEPRYARPTISTKQYNQIESSNMIGKPMTTLMFDDVVIL
ncbi:unnamed protein product, partial [Rotaria sp. Silwood2]